MVCQQTATTLAQQSQPPIGRPEERVLQLASFTVRPAQPIAPITSEPAESEERGLSGLPAVLALDSDSQLREESGATHRTETDAGPIAMPQTETSGRSIEDYVALALAANPKLTSMMHRVSALQQRVVLSRSLPDPAIHETFWPFNGNALETAGGRAASQLGVTQSIPWPKKLSAKAAIACREVQVAQSQLEDTRLAIIESVQLSCLEIWFADEAIQAVDDFGDLVKQLNDVSEAQYRSGRKNTGQLDVLRARIESDRLEDRAVQLLRQKKIAQADLAKLIHQPNNLNIELSANIPTSSTEQHIEELIGLAGSCNPSLQGLAHEIARDRERQRLACLQKYPDLQIGANWLIVSADDAVSPVATGNDNFGFTVGMTLPIWRDKINAGVAEAAHQTQGSVELLSSERDTIAAKLRRLVAQFDSLSEQQRILVERIIPRTEDALRLSFADYSGNRTDFPSVVEMYEERLTLELQRIRIQANIAGTIAQIERQVGCIPGASF